MTIPHSAITFHLDDDRAIAIVKRATAALHLRVLTFPDGHFTVLVADPRDVYQLAELCAKDPAWAGLFAQEGT